MRSVGVTLLSVKSYMKVVAQVLTDTVHCATTMSGAVHHITRYLVDVEDGDLALLLCLPNSVNSRQSTNKKLLN
jgi:uncharacterized protein YaaQ